MNIPLETSTPSISPRVALRPSIPIEKPASSAAEQFQNEVFRPILKMQNELFLKLYKHFLAKRKVRFEAMSLEKRQAWIETSISKDNRLRGLLLGMVIGQFTGEELTQFLEMEGEIRRRISTLITQRLQSQSKALL